MVDAPENIGLVRGMLGLRLWNKHDDNDQSNAIEYTRSDLVAELEAENERLKQEVENWKTSAAGWQKIANVDAEALSRTGAVKVKALEWEDADEGMCTKWRAAALGGHYELVALDGDDGGLSVNFHWGRPLSFWFIQGEADEWGPTGPKIFPTLKAAKAAAQADYERRILPALEPHPRATNTVDAHETANVSDKPEGQQEPVAWEWAAFEEGERRGAWTPCGYGDEAGWKALVKRNPAKYRVETRPLFTLPSEQAVTRRC